MNNHYTYLNNILAYNFLMEQGYTPTLGYHANDNGSDIEREYADSYCFFWDYDGTGGDFNKLLSDNGLLLSQQNTSEQYVYIDYFVDTINNVLVAQLRFNRVANATETIMERLNKRLMAQVGDILSVINLGETPVQWIKRK